MVRDDARTERLGVQDLHNIDAHMLENPRPFSESERKHENAELIHKAMRDHRVCQLAHAIL